VNEKHDIRSGEETMKVQKLLSLGGIGNVMIGLLHVVIAFKGPWAYRYFGAGEDMAQAAEQGSLAPAGSPWHSPASSSYSGSMLAPIVFARRSYH
jgi:hypothetical protein